MYIFQTSSGNWYDPAKWTPNGIPGPQDTAIIKGRTVTLDSAAAISVFKIYQGGILTGSGTLTITDSMHWVSGDMTGTGVTRIDPGAVAFISHGSSTIDLDIRTLENFGAIIWQGTGVWKLKQQAQIINRPGAVFDVQRDGTLDFVQDWNGGSFLNEGILKKTAGTGRVEIDPLFTNSPGGQALSYSGNLRFERGSAAPSSGLFYADSGAIIQISERPFKLGSAAFSGGGAVEIVDLATVEITGAGVTVDSFTTLRMNTGHLGAAGFLQGDGPLVINGIFDWKEGNVAGSGDFIVNGSAITSPGGSRELNGRTLANSGLFILTETLGLANNALLINQSGGILEIQNNGYIDNDDAIGGMVFNNGTFFRNGDPGNNEIEVDFENSGILDIQSGALSFNETLTNVAPGIIQGSGVLDISDAVFDNYGGLSPGASPGILTITGDYSPFPSAELNIEIGGKVAGLQYDQLNISGSAQLQETLNILLVDNFRPVFGDTFYIMNYSAHSGQFAIENIPSINGQQVFNVEYRAGAVLLISNYIPQFILTVGTAGSGAITLDPPGGVYDSLTVVKLTATPDPGYVFSGWSGDLGGSANPDSVVMDAAKSVTATFQEIAPLAVNVKAFLEGPYHGGAMATTVKDSGGLPPAQPYNTSPWNYSGEENVTNIAAGVVDWVLLALRSSENADDLAYRAAFIKADGSIVDTSGSGGVKFETVPFGDYFVVIYHRNHLAIMSSMTLALTDNSALYDFTAMLNRAYGSDPMKEVETGIFAMIAGDGNSDGMVNNDDKTIWRSENGAAWSYSKPGDFNLDGGIDVLDLNYYWRANNGSQGSVPGASASAGNSKREIRRGEEKNQPATALKPGNSKSPEAPSKHNLPEKQLNRTQQRETGL